MALVAASALGACRAAPPDAPVRGAVNVSGAWSSADSAAALTGFRLELADDGSGVVTGRWSARDLEASGADSLRTGAATGAFTAPTAVHLHLVGFFGLDLYGTIAVAGADTLMRAEFRSPDFLIAENGEHFTIRFARR